MKRGVRLALELSYLSRLNKMLKAVIIDDEIGGRETLEYLVKRHVPEIEILGLGKSVKDGLKLIAECGPDLVFLDIEMTDGSGFDLIAQAKHRDFGVIFVTAYDRYAMQAFRVAALDYILKPVGVEDLKAAVKKAQKKMKHRVHLYERVKAIRQNLTKPADASNLVALPTALGFEFFEVRDIIRFEASESHSEVSFLDGSTLQISKKLSDLEEQFEPYRFFRIHRSHFINLTHIKRYLKGRGGIVEMVDGSKVEVSRRKKEEFLQYFETD